MQPLFFTCTDRMSFLKSIQNLKGLKKFMCLSDFRVQRGIKFGNFQP